MPTVYVTAPPEAAPEIATDLVESELAACVNRVTCRSTYRWEGEVHDDEEEILLCKTTDRACGDLVDRVEEIHPYDVPCIERFDEEDVAPDFAAWVEDSTGGSPD